MRYSIRKLRRKLKRLEGLPPPKGTLNAVLQRFASDGTLPAGERLRVQVARRAFAMAEFQIATCVHDADEAARVRRALNRYFRGLIGTCDAPPGCREAVERVAAMLARDVGEDEIANRVQGWVGRKLDPELSRKLVAAALPLASLIKWGVVRVPYCDPVPPDDA